MEEGYEMNVVLRVHVLFYVVHFPVVRSLLHCGHKKRCVGKARVPGRKILMEWEFSCARYGRSARQYVGIGSDS